MFTIRQATKDDITLIRRLAGEVFPKTYKDILTPEQIMYMMDWMYSADSLWKQMEVEGHIYFLAFCQEDAVGYVSIQQEEEDLFHLQKIYVLPRYQQAHCGSALFHHVVGYIRSVHPSPCRMELNVNRHNPALHFYHRMGMTPVREGDFPIGNGYYMNDYIMSLDIR